MFSRKNTSFDLATEMEKNLQALAKAEIVAPINKIANAIEHLNRAAEIFDENGLHMEAEIATRLLEVFAAKKSKKKKSSKPSKKPAKKPSKSSKPATKKPTKKPTKTDEATKDLDSDKMVENLKEKGWVFNADDQLADDNFVMHRAENCDCSMCNEMGMADDNFAHNMGPMDDPAYEKDENEQDLARIMGDLDDAHHAEQEMHDFEDDTDEVFPGDDTSRSMRYFRPGDNR